MSNVIDHTEFGTWPIGLNPDGSARSVTLRKDDHGRPVLPKRSRYGWVPQPNRKGRCIDLLGVAYASAKSATCEVQQIGTDGAVLWVVGAKDRRSALRVIGLMTDYDLGLHAPHNAAGRKVGCYILVED